MTNNRRTKGEGSICLRKDGRWVGRHTVTEPNGKRKVRSVYATTKTECQKKLRIAITEAERGNVAVKSGYTVESFSKLWLETQECTHGLKPATLDLYEGLFRLHILPIIGKMRLDRLTPLDVSQMVRTLTIQGKSGNCCRVAKNALASMLSYAQCENLIIGNPARGIKNMPKCERRDIYLWTKEELDAFLNMAKQSSRYYPIYFLLATYGLRRGEALGLRPIDIHCSSGDGADLGYIDISQQVTPVKNKPTISTLKTEASKRRLPLTKEARDLLLPLVENCTGRLLFHTSNNTPIAPRNLVRDYEHIIKLADLKYMRMHGLRHLACTFMVESEIDVKTAQEILGHSQISTTLGIYASTNIKKKRAALNKLGCYLLTRDNATMPSVTS